MSRRQRSLLRPEDTDIRDTEHGDIWYTRAGVKYLMDKAGKVVTSYKVSGDSRPTKVPNPNARLSDYDVLKAAGHSPLKALQIVVDARRDDAQALLWINEARKQHE